MNRATIEVMYRRYGPMVLRRARTLLGDESAAQDAMHEVFLRALDAGGDFRGEASPMTWLYRITTNHCLNQIRNSTRRRELLGENAPVQVDALPVDEARLTINQLLQQLPDELREIAIYYYVDELKHDEIATLVGVSRRTVGNRLEAFRSFAKTKLDPPMEMNHG